MLKIWIYFIVLVVLCVIGFAIGSANDGTVVFDFLFIKSQMSLATLFAIGIGVGVLLGVYISLLFCLRVFAKSLNLKSQLRQAKKQEAKLLKEQKETQKA